MNTEEQGARRLLRKMENLERAVKKRDDEIKAMRESIENDHKLMSRLQTVIERQGHQLERVIRLVETNGQRASVALARVGKTFAGLAEILRLLAGEPDGPVQTHHDGQAPLSDQTSHPGERGRA